MTLPTVRISLKLSPWQQQLDASKKRFKLARAGRRSGKTHYVPKWMLDRAAIKKRPIFYIAPTQKQAKELMWQPLKAFVPPPLISDISEQALNIRLKNGNFIGVRGSDNENAIRGFGLGGAVLEEAGFQKQHIWDEIVRPQLADDLGEALLISTPNPKQAWFRRQEEAAKKRPEEWDVFYATPYDNPFLPPGEIESIKADLLAKGKSDVWEQEYMAQYIDRVGIVYWELDELEHTTDTDLSSKVRFWVRGMDWGIDDYTAVIWIGLLESGAIYVHTEYVVNNTAIATIADVMRQKSIGRLIQASVMDASAFKRESDFSSVARRFASLGIKTMPGVKTPDLGISAIKELMGNNRIIFNRSCGALLDGMKSWNWEQHEPDPCAALRYGISYLVQANHIKLTGIIAPTPTRTHQMNMQERLQQIKDNAKIGQMMNNKTEYKCFKVIPSSRWGHDGY